MRQIVLTGTALDEAGTVIREMIAVSLNITKTFFSIIMSLKKFLTQNKVAVALGLGSVTALGVFWYFNS